MSILPQASYHFQLKEYWDKFFTKRSSTFEWYGEYTDLCHVLHKYIKPPNRILVVGCGNSKLSEELYDAGFHAIENIDISDIVLKQMSARNKKKRPEMTFVKMDVLQMTYEDGSFDCIIDKGTLDAIFSTTDVASLLKARKMFQEMERVLKVTGRYICVTLAQDHVRQMLLRYFETGWLVRLHKISLEGVSGFGGSLPVFIVVMTKMAKIEGRPPVKVYERMYEDGTCTRYHSVEELGMSVKANQEYAMMTHYLRNLHADEPPMRLDFHGPEGGREPKYSLYIIDLPKRKAKKGPFAIFITPQGRELDWLFASEEGRKQVAETAGFERLVIVTLHRGHRYPSVEMVREEVEGDLVNLMQGGLAQGKYPVLTQDDGLGSRTTIYEGSSPMSGDFVVEESPGRGGEVVRRLVFLSAPHLVQTEVHVLSVKQKKKSKKKKSKKKKEPDPTTLSSSHLMAMVASLALLRGLVVDSVSNGVSGKESTAIKNGSHKGESAAMVDVSRKDKSTTVKDGNHEDNSTAIKDGSHEGESATIDESVSEVSGIEVNVATRTGVSTDKDCQREETEVGSVGGSQDHTKVAMATGGGDTSGYLKQVLVVGLGGGALPQYIHRHIPTTSMEVLEVDPHMLEVAEKWFWFSQDERMRVHIADGVEFMKQSVGEGKKGCYHAIILDVDSKDPSTGLSSPPPSFVNGAFLAAVRTLLHDDGLFITNLATRSTDLRNMVIAMMWSAFHTVLRISIPEDVNEILIGLPCKRDDIVSSPDLMSSAGSKEPPRMVLTSELRGHVTALAGMISGRSLGVLESQDVEEQLLEYLEKTFVYSAK